MSTQNLSHRCTFSGDLTRVEQLRMLLPFAILSPSQENSQPWKFRVLETGVEVHSDPEFALHVADPEGKELAMSMGAVAHRFSIAMRCYGMSPRISYLSDHQTPCLFIRIDWVGESSPSPLDLMLMSQISKRRRIPEQDDQAPLKSYLQEDLSQAAAEFETVLQWVGHESHRRFIGELLNHTEVMLGRKKEYRDELSQWLRTKDTGRDGVPAELIGFTGLRRVLAPWIMEHVDLGKNSVGGICKRRLPLLG